MSSCRDVAESLFDWTTGELPPERVAVLEAHLVVCTPCAVLVESYHVTVRLARRMPPVLLPDAARDRLAAALGVPRGGA